MSGRVPNLMAYLLNIYASVASDADSIGDYHDDHEHTDIRHNGVLDVEGRGALGEPCGRALAGAVDSEGCLASVRTDPGQYHLVCGF